MASPATCCAVLVGLTAAAIGAPPRSPVNARALLGEIAAFTDEDWGNVERGIAVAKVLDTDTREIAVAGAVRVRARADRLVARVRDVEHLKRSAVVLDVGRFDRSPIPSDLERAAFEEYNLDLRECRPGDCRVRLTEGDIATFHRGVDWRAPDWRDRSARTWRQVLAAHAAAYAREGRSALPVYTNKVDPLSVASELALLSEKFGFVGRFSNDVARYLRGFAPELPVGSSSTLYWSKEDFGVRPVFRISHQIIFETPAGVVIATNQIYADHYLDAALGLTMAVASPDGNGESFYMIAVNRARTRSLSGFLRRLVRGTVQGRSREAMRKILTATRSALESNGSHD